jgi:metal-dependent HD superfamily phosphatase/phosphodiesterase
MAIETEAAIQAVAVTMAEVMEEAASTLTQALDPIGGKIKRNTHKFFSALTNNIFEKIVNYISFPSFSPHFKHTR